ncbi:MAG: tetratricopeptide repeat protein [Spirochaetaceae bacterium]|nr:tetratricopeptide repeat protein [Spirochaetaceae bacterium]
MTKRSRYGVPFKRKKLLRLAVAVIAAGGLVWAVFSVRTFQSRANRERSETVGYWQTGDYAEAFRSSGVQLQKAPMDYFFLTVYGYSAYQLAFSQINSSETMRYIDECIFALRKAALTQEGIKDGRVYYVLGKAYYFKGAEYADLCVEYLEKAKAFAWEANDSAEYLGLSYARLGDYRASVAAFAEALNTAGDHPPGTLLLAIARSYVELGEDAIAESYLVRCLETSRDVDTAVEARLMLGRILRERDDYDRAEQQYLAIIAEVGETAAARHELGELYLAQGDVARARSEWRKANRIDPAFAPSIARINERFP